VRFSLQDIQKHVQRRGGELAVTLHFLKPGESRDEIARLIAYHEQALGQPQRALSMDDARALVGDYRLAHCLVDTLGAWYSWRSPDWDKVTLRMGGGAGKSALHEAGITSPIQLRLSLFDYVNAHHAGFLDAQHRAQVLEQFAAHYGLGAAELEYLFSLDSDDEAILARDGIDRPPMPDEVAALYNQWAFEAALSSASEAHFVIDCKAFLEVATMHAATATPAPVTGVGAVIKCLGYLARKLGVYYDLSYEEHSARLHLTLYGPQDMTGAPQQYGVRLARLCRMLLGYGSPIRSPGRAILPRAAIVQACAVVHFLQRAYRFGMDAGLLALLPGQEEGGVDGVYDSGVEQAFAEAFAALARSSAADGWQLEREPEPLLISAQGEASQTIFIPDFALTRDRHRLYLEILGFWTPSYRERKVQKLQQFKGRQDIVLAMPVEARGAFASLAHDFPLVEYDGQLSATELLQALRHHIDDFAERLAGVDSEQVRRRVREEGWLPERACFAALHCYRRSEVARAAETISGDGIDFTPGVGLYDRTWLEHIGSSFVAWLGEREHGRAQAAEALQACRARWPVLAESEDAALEALLGLFPGVRMRRSSIFEAIVELAGIADSFPEEDVMQAHASTSKKVVRERRAAYKKRSAGAPDEPSASQQILWDM
jgi:predicted nuclease of restriction endonuclease-like RecB superfamily